MKCPYCQQEHPQGTNFCPNTGNPISVDYRNPTPYKQGTSSATITPAPIPGIRQSKWSDSMATVIAGVLGLIFIIAAVILYAGKLNLPFLGIPPSILSPYTKTALESNGLSPTEQILTGGSVSAPSPEKTEIAPALKEARTLTTISGLMNTTLAYESAITETVAAWKTTPDITSTPIIEPTAIYAPVLTYPCVSYYVGSGLGDLRLACKRGGVWEKEVVASKGDVGRYNSLAFDFEGEPHLSYFNETDHSLDYAYKKDGQWYVETVDNEGDVGWFTSLAFDLKWNPMITYFEKNSNSLKFAWRTDGEWHTEIIEEIGAPRVIRYQAGIFSSLAVNRDGNPIVAYDYESTRDLRFAERVNGEWKIEEVDVYGDVGRHCSMALDSTGNPAISYYDSDNISLKYAIRRGNGWDIQVAEGYGIREVGVFSSLAFTSIDIPVIGYFDESWDDLRFASWNGRSWVQEAVDVNGHTGGYSSLALDRFDTPYLACFFWDGGALRVWHKGKEKWEMEQVDTYSFSDKQVGLHVKIRFVPEY